MGFNTAVIICNDFIHQIAENPSFGSDIRTAINMAHRCRPIGGGFSLLPSHHADTAQIVVVGGNNIRSLGFGRRADTDEELLRKLASDHGYRLVRKRSYLDMMKSLESEEAR